MTKNKKKRKRKEKEEGYTKNKKKKELYVGSSIGETVKQKFGQRT